MRRKINARPVSRSGGGKHSWTAPTPVRPATVPVEFSCPAPSLGDLRKLFRGRVRIAGEASL